MTDRPVYRPKQAVNFKLWVRKAKYDLQDSSVFAGQRFQVRIHSPKNEQVYSQSLTADEYGGVAGEFKLPVDAALGVYRISHTSGGHYGGQTFRVEEYKKPEFEVKIQAFAIVKWVQKKGSYNYHCGLKWTQFKHNSKEKLKKYINIINEDK